LAIVVLDCTGFVRIFEAAAASRTDL